MLLSAVPRDRRQPYRIRDILRAVFDLGSLMEVQGALPASPGKPSVGTRP
jgi:acetyl-CoA carboxylase carboxyltransferase component